MKFNAMFNTKSILFVMAIFFLSFSTQLAAQTKEKMLSSNYVFAEEDGKYGVYCRSTKKIVVEAVFDRPVFHLKNETNNLFFMNGTGERIQMWKVRPNEKGEPSVIFLGTFTSRDAPEVYAYLYE
jgi:hypothetical protein